MRGERLEPRRQRPRAADEDPDDGRPEIVVRDASRDPVEVRKGADMPVEKADLILALVDPREVAARVHQPHQEQPRLPPGPVDVDQHLEEVDFGQIARPIRQRHEDLAALPLPFRDRVFDNGHAYAMPLGHQQLVQPRGRQSLLAARPPGGVDEHRLHPLGDRVPHRPRPRRRLLFSKRDRLIEVLPDRDARQSQLTGDGPLRPPLHQHFVSNDMYLIHPEHPSSELRIPRSGKPAVRPSGGLLSERRLVYFLSGAPRWRCLEWPQAVSGSPQMGAIPSIVPMDSRLLAVGPWASSVKQHHAAVRATWRMANNRHDTDERNTTSRAIRLCR